MSDYERCGRPTQQGRPCQLGRRQLRYFDPLGWTPPACALHLTGAEWDEMHEIEAAYSERLRQKEQRERQRILAERTSDPFPFRRRVCGRQGCGRSPVVWLVTIELPDPHVCYGHLSEHEREALDSAQQEVQERLERLGREPDCWSWPIPAPREYANEEEASDALHEWQHGRGCAICGSPGTRVEDHDHRSGLVRGELCHTCNIREGMGHSSPPFVKYRQRNPASILGVKVRYWSSFTGYAEPEPELSEAEKAAEHRTLRDAVDRLSLPSLESLRDAEPLPQEASET